MAVEALKGPIEYCMKWNKDRNRIYVDETVLLLAPLDARTGCVATTKNTDVGRGAQSRMLFTILYEITWAVRQRLQ